MIFKQLSVVYAWSSGCKRELRANKESVLTKPASHPPPNIQSTHPVHHHEFIVDMILISCKVRFITVETCPAKAFLYILTYKSLVAESIFQN